MTLLWGGWEARRPPWAHPDHGALGCGLARGGQRTAPPLRSCPQSLGAEEEVPNSQEGAWLGPRPLRSAPRSCEGAGEDTPKPEDATSVPPPPTFCPQQDPWQGRQPPPPHPAGQKSLNSGLRKVFVQLVTQDPPESPTQWEHRGRGRHGWGTVWAHLAPSLASVPHSWGRGVCLRWEEVWKR